MFIGHFAVAFGAKKFAPQVSLGVFFLACQLADLIWPNLVLSGIESVEIELGNTAITPLHFAYYPYSHSLIGLVLWSVIFAVCYLLLQRAKSRVAIVIALVIISHWVLDVITHRADMPIMFDNSLRIGFGLWNFPVQAIAFELLLFAIGVWAYSRCTTALNRRGEIGFWALVLFLLAVYIANLLGPPPPSAVAVAWTAQALWLIVAWGFWVDHNRVNRNTG